MTIGHRLFSDDQSSATMVLEGSAADGLESPLALVLALVRLRARCRIEWLRTLWRADPPPTPGRQVSHAEVDHYLDDRDSPALELAWLAAESDPEEAAALRDVEAALAAGSDSRLARLIRVFGLGPVERDLLYTCLAAEIEPAMLRVYAYLQDHPGRACVTDALVARLFQHGRTVVVDGDAPLARWRMIASVEPGPGEPRLYTLDPAIRDWLMGGSALDPELAGIARLQSDLPPLAEWPVEETVSALRRWLTRPDPIAVRIRICGTPGSGRRTFAAAVANRIGLPLLSIDATSTDASGWPRLYLKAQRQAFLDGCAIAFSGEAPFTCRVPENIAHFPLQFLIGETVRSAPLTGRAVDHLVELPPLSLAGRRSLWGGYVPWSAAWPEAEREALITQHRTVPADLARLGSRGPGEPSEAAAILRESARQSLGELAHRLECPFGRQDLVLPASLDRSLDDLLFEARERAAFWERAEAIRLFPQGRGLLSLFAGPPGTGKTMTAQVIAAELGMDLFRIDLAAVVSKWVGETSRNLDRLLARAARLDVVLLFDEADALFGKRTEVKEANDRFANTDTGYLLQAIESFRGIAILSSNRKSDIDPAFLRRLRYLLDYPLPDESERLRIWRRVIETLLGPERERALRADLERIATTVEVTGAQIKFGVLNAVFAARRAGRPVDLKELLRGLERELGKEGRPLGERARERLAPHAG